ncbi:hypothetical protein HPHPH44_1364 [Helicobacter pylori Hp H-44]|nr:hypothetical protein HPHPH44_1364 [Helicobacter pylori Hp H-44]
MLTTTKTEISALRICSLMGNITLESSSLANLYCMSHLFIVSFRPYLMHKAFKMNFQFYPK